MERLGGADSCGRSSRLFGQSVRHSSPSECERTTLQEVQGGRVRRHWKYTHRLYSVEPFVRFRTARHYPLAYHGTSTEVCSNMDICRCIPDSCRFSFLCITRRPLSPPSSIAFLRLPCRTESIANSSW